jgi:hypothetical protein
MMAICSTNLALTATTLIQTYGESVSFSREAEGAYNPADGTVGTSVDTTYILKGVPTKFSSGEIDGQLVQINDVLLLAEKTDDEPKIGDVATIENTGYRVLNVSEIRMQGSTLAYRLQLRV